MAEFFLAMNTFHYRENINMVANNNAQHGHRAVLGVVSWLPGLVV